LYSEAEQPQHFFKIVAISYASVTLVVAAFLGILGYLAFGDQTMPVILSNMPETEAIGVIARVSYLFAILGCWVIILQPIFYLVESSEYYERMGDFSFWQMK
jgi:amino acid permease